MSEYVIPIKVHNEEKLYTPFDYSGLSFSSELTEYLTDAVANRKIGEKVSIDLISDAGVDVNRFQNAYNNLMDKLKQRNQRELVKCNIAAIRLLLIGIVFIVLGLTLAPKLNDILAAIISTIGSFSVWEASAHWIEALPELRKNKRILATLSQCEIRKNEVNNNG
ncbi:MAG: hypothetical protein IJ643_01760 [Eubacterium sp.]|nr:hypothetical protein [Eubacterium sp.]